jgi:C1A family cysteine protease
MPGLGCIKDTPDNRDFKFKTAKFFSSEKQNIIPESDLRKYQSPIRNQEEIGACTGFAIAALRAFLEVRESWDYAENKTWTICKLFRTAQAKFATGRTIYSPRFIYYEERIMEGSYPSDDGAMIRTGMKVLNTKGAALEKDCKYYKEDFNDQPSPKAYRVAKDHQVFQYHRLTNLVDECRIALSNKHMVVGGILVHDSFMNIKKDGIISMPGSRDRNMGGHAITLVGHNDDKEYFILRNSWGTTWGDAGYGYLPYEYLNRSLAWDFWCCDKWE